ncbi:peptide/nickel transport system permease protein [Tranquillimonas rosea]|uniref:Peptide/nickel transport system permease protein n=1 Tax=Tranquillimonas rosea TaxID=641238 RepID=A0A1H9X359_9RHOB|nr:ABC transporter permease [Tranquillimonas rosea]SES40580.1 peptide/nickel transport system permease protein [Tranquillimonas rosea]
MTALEILSRGPGGTRGGRHPLWRGAGAAGLVLLILAAAALMPEPWLDVNAQAVGRAPGPAHALGTDSLGRDVAARTLAALAMSVKIGLLAATASTAIALILGLAAALGRVADHVVGVLTELVLGLPHFVLLIMVAFATGAGATGVIFAVALTHWPRLARVLRHEAQTVAASDYVATSRALGRSRPWIARHHLAPHLLPQVVAGFVLIFPHAILHEAGLSFIGLGIEPHLPSIGVMLSDSLREIVAGHWWVAAAPGAGLVIVALSFERFGEVLRAATAPPEGTP